MKYQEHFLLDCDEVISYVKEKNLFSENANLTVKEIGDGNINYIFKVENVVAKYNSIFKGACCSIQCFISKYEFKFFELCI